MNDNTLYFHPEILLGKLEGDVDLVRELLEAFSEDAPLRLATLSQAIAVSDCHTAAEAAHSLKGMCGVIRIQKLVDLSLSMERACRNNEMQQVPAMLEDFQKTMKTALEEVQTYLAR